MMGDNGRNSPTVDLFFKCGIAYWLHVRWGKKRVDASRLLAFHALH